MVVCGADEFVININNKDYYICSDARRHYVLIVIFGGFRRTGDFQNVIFQMSLRQKGS